MLSHVPLMYFPFPQLNQLLDLDAKFGVLNGDRVGCNRAAFVAIVFYPHSCADLL